MQYDFDDELLAKLSENIARVKADIRSCCIAAGRDPEEVTLIGVSKVFPVEYAEAAVMAGLKDLGENRVQEMMPKIERPLVLCFPQEASISEGCLPQRFSV